jgi:hypothetical protein
MFTLRICHTQTVRFSFRLFSDSHPACCSSTNVIRLRFHCKQIQIPKEECDNNATIGSEQLRGSDLQPSPKNNLLTPGAIDCGLDFQLGVVMIGGHQ